MREIPTITNLARASSTNTLAAMMATTPVTAQQAYGGVSLFDGAPLQLLEQHHAGLGADRQRYDSLRNADASPAPVEEEEVMAKNQRRLVQVFIVDPDENVPLADAIIYRGDQVFTDLTDQELFFDIDLKGALAEHNVKRKAIVDKAVSDRTQYLEPARIRDLKMTVTVIATF